MAFPVPMNTSGELYALTMSVTQNLTGSIALTLLLTVMLFIFLCFLFRLPLWVSAIFLMPYFVVTMAYTSEIMPVAVITVMYLGFVLADVFWIK